MKQRILPSIGLCLLVASGLWLATRHSVPPVPVANHDPGPTPASSSAPAPPPPEATPPARLLSEAPQNFPAPPPLQGESAEAQIDMDKINLKLRDYRTLTGSNPVGTNAEIMRAIMGANPKGANLGPPEGASLNGNGELLDRWGTPYFFHQLSGSHMEVRSAGPDRKMWTTDDVILK